MTPQDKNLIVGYLTGPRDHNDGVAMYQRFGQNLRLKRLFATDDTANTREILFEELRKLAGLTQLEFDQLPRNAVLSGGVIGMAKPKQKDRPQIQTSDYEAAPPIMKKMIRFRERFPFLNSPDCPDVLKILVADMFASYDNYKAAHARLQTLADDDTATAVAECEKVVTEYLKNREIWDELEYYREHCAVLGKAAKFREMEAAEDYSELSEIDLMKKLQSANVNESKHRKTVNAAKEKGETNERAEAALARWAATKKAIQEEVARRKKK